MKKSMFERDILYPTQKIYEPGSVHVTVYPPVNSGGIPVVIESKTEHNPLEYINEIISIIQTDVFDRIRINLKTSGILYIKSHNQREASCKITFDDKDKYSIEEVLDVDSLI